MRIGTPATVNLATGAAIEGRVRYVRQQASLQTRTFQVEVEIPNRGGNVPAGMSAEIVLHADPVAAVIVPRSVVTLSDKGALGVRTVGDDGTVAFVPVEVVDDTPDGLVLDGVPRRCPGDHLRPGPGPRRRDGARRARRLGQRRRRACRARRRRLMDSL